MTCVLSPTNYVNLLLSVKKISRYEAFTFLSRYRRKTSDFAKVVLAADAVLFILIDQTPSGKALPILNYFSIYAHYFLCLQVHQSKFLKIILIAQHSLLQYSQH